MYLNVNDSHLIDEPDCDAVMNAVQTLDQDEYAILTQDDNHYVQTRRNDDDTWSLEYRNGSAEQHFAANEESTTVAQVCQAFRSFFDGDDISGLLEWERIDSEATPPDEGEVEYNGVVMDAEWPAVIEAAQEIATVELGDAVFKRVAFGDEKNLPTDKMDNCGDCGVLRKQLHVPDCDIEQCPKCLGQLITCGCDQSD